MTDKTSHLLSKIGITIGKGNKLELDEDELKKADISSLKTIFTGYNSFAGKTEMCIRDSSWRGLVSGRGQGACKPCAWNCNRNSTRS